MKDILKGHLQEIERFSAKSLIELEEFRIKYLGKKGLMNDFFEKFKTIAPEEKKKSVS
jgi:phenylalanyl-tRNA synthetase alpha chain